MRLDVVSEPLATPGCYENEYALRGIAFRRAPRPPMSAAPPASGTSLKALGALVGQRVVVHLRSGKVLAGTVAALTPPDDLHLVLLGQRSRHVKPTDIDKATPAAGARGQRGVPPCAGRRSDTGPGALAAPYGFCSLRRGAKRLPQQDPLRCGYFALMPERGLTRGARAGLFLA